MIPLSLSIPTRMNIAKRKKSVSQSNLNSNPNLLSLPLWKISYQVIAIKPKKTETIPPNLLKSRPKMEILMSPNVISIRIIVGTQVFTSCASTFLVLWVNFLKARKRTKRDAIAPSSTAKKSPGLALRKKKLLKFIFRNPASIILGGSPISVAAPCRFELIAIAIKKGTGETFNFLEISKAMGATIITVATFSQKADINPENAETKRIAKPTVFVFETSLFAINAGTLDIIKTSATMAVPKKIPMTFQLIASTALWNDINLKTKRRRTPAQRITVFLL